MSTQCRSGFLLTAILCASSLSCAWGADFTFTVPVALSNLPPDSRGGFVNCILFAPIRPGRPTGPLDGGGGSTHFTISSGAYRGEVVVPVDAPAGIDPATVTEYSCAISFNATLRGSDHQFSFFNLGAPTTFPLAPGAPYNPNFRGPIR